MSSGHRTMTLFVTVILGLILVIVGLSAELPQWAWPTFAAILLVIAAVTNRLLAPSYDLAEPPGQEVRLRHVALPSSVADYDFSFSATVHWLLLDVPDDSPPVNPAGLAMDAVVQRARVVAAQQPPERSALVQHELEGALATMRTDPTGRVMAMAVDVSVSLPELDRERLVKLSNVRKDEDVWEHERNYERSKRAYLGDDVLKDTGSAVVWWLSRNEEEVSGAVDRIGLFAQLSAAARNEAVAPPFDHLVEPPHHERDEYGYEAPRPFAPEAEGTAGELSVDDVLAWFGVHPGDPDLDLFAARLLKAADLHGRTDAADALRRRIGDGNPPGEDEANGAPVP
ncbi:MULTISPECIES: hypothetical protein [unclassified Streptomyces]|uniref:hypothetical protein n=1 Tax=unclassified Streptomyces TaxID=2593676 RepID=UPI0013A6C450|nr:MULTISPECIES: hypothetical protein [unclassified Streptomyces]QZZ26705.1 hypothetical protein A7X85_10960 [Streptomyces sp. ST1015]